MKLKSTATELLVFSAAVGLLSTFAAPWMELRGSYAAWRITEWHTFWRGPGAFLLADVVAANYRVPIEFATTGMQETVSRLFILGAVLGAWHSAVFVALVLAGARRRWHASCKWRVVAQAAVLVAASAVALYLCAVLFALPSSLSLKVDFRSPGDIHADSLVWSSVNVFLAAPLLSLLALLVQVGTPAWIDKPGPLSTL